MTDVRTERLVLHPIQPAEARRIVAREPGPAEVWHPEYPWADELDPLRILAGDADPHPVFTLYQVRAPQGPSATAPARLPSGVAGWAVGGIGFFGPPDEAGAVELGYGLVPAARGHGYATEALVAIVRLAVDAGAHLIRADTDLGNIASQRVLTRAGFTAVGQERGLAFFELCAPA